jgi:hypothetical protein
MLWRLSRESHDVDCVAFRGTAPAQRIPVRLKAL